jgi:thioester reductase-like protein
VTTANAARHTVLVTGGTGFVGSAIVDALGAMSVVSLSRHGSVGWTGPLPRRGASVSSLLPELHGHVVPAVEERRYVRQVRGDITKPLFGLCGDEYQRLAESVDVVVHAAGTSDFTVPKAATQELNVEGTREVVRFAERAGLPLYHVSTGYVGAEGRTMNGRWGAGVYINSKREAERLLERCDVLEAIVRPSIVFGDSRTGWSPSFQGLHREIGMILEDKLPLLPFGPEVRIDFLPRDVIGHTIASLVRARFRGEFWLTAGNAALTVGRVVALLMEYGKELRLDLHPPRFVSQEMVERLLKPAGGRAVARRIDLLGALTSHFSSSPELPSSLPDAKKGDLEDAFMRGARYWVRYHGAATAESEVSA